MGEIVVLLSHLLSSVAERGTVPSAVLRLVQGTSLPPGSSVGGRWLQMCNCFLFDNASVFASLTHSEARPDRDTWGRCSAACTIAQCSAHRSRDRMRLQQQQREEMRDEYSELVSLTHNGVEKDSEAYGESAASIVLLRSDPNKTFVKKSARALESASPQGRGRPRGKKTRGFDMEIYYTTKIQGRVGQVAGWSKVCEADLSLKGLWTHACPLLAGSGIPRPAGSGPQPQRCRHLQRGGESGVTAMRRTHETRSGSLLPMQGRPLNPSNELTIRNVRSTECMRLAWHPLLPLLAIGWKDGGSHHDERRVVDAVEPRAHATAAKCRRHHFLELRGASLGGRQQDAPRPRDLVALEPERRPALHDGRERKAGGVEDGPPDEADPHCVLRRAARLQDQGLRGMVTHRFIAIIHDEGAAGLLHGSHGAQR